MTDELQEDAGGEQRELTQEEYAAALVQRLGRIPVRDVVFQTMATLADMASIRMGLGPEGDEVGDLQQARHAIEALRALMEMAEAEFGAAQARPFREPLAQLQNFYAHLVEAGVSGEPTEGAPADAGPAPAEAPPQPPADDPASRLWVPPQHRKA
jgi:Domain of unknown function (DUF1844)